MWEVLLTAEVGKFVLEKVLDLGKSALEDYVKDFFKDCIQGSISAAKADTLKQPMADAIGQFIKRFVEELQINGVEKPSIDHHYGKVIKKFVQDKAVRPLLGKAFETDCTAIDYQQLEKIWQQGYLDSGYSFPQEFDWRGVAKKYVFEVKGIVKGNAELRSLLTIDLQEQQTESLKQIAGINPGFDVEKYRESLQCSYGYLKLYALDSTYQADAIKLWQIFIEQTVREALPPLRYEVPLDVKRQLQAEGGLEDDLSPEALAVYRQEYFQQPARKVLEALTSGRSETISPLAPNTGGTGLVESRSVILGDPGAGKSTLLQYLALEWVEGKTESLPLLIELREYVLDGMKGFLEFWHRGQGADWQFDSLQLYQHLLEQPTIVMFDGLDEVFDRATQSTIVDEIVRFSQQYPRAQVLLTSRIIGYNPERLQQAGFKQFTIQPLDREEIHEFIDRWYDLALGADPDKVRLVTRLKDAIENSKAIQNLADNPLLLTMMAILNRRQELPRDRADLYDQASRVLLYHWDVDHKRLQLPMDTIGRREKQEMLRLIAYEMQTSDEGLKGNLIRADRLVRILTDYLKEQGFEAPREKANGLIEQLRHRNWILCDRGADTYGFVHRTFLEYFCAMEIVHRFEKSRSISFEQLRDEVFGQHWQDETWHEVLKLICGAIDPEFTKQLIEFLTNQNGDFSKIYLAVDCLVEIPVERRPKEISNQLLKILMQIFEENRKGVRARAIEKIEKGWADDSEAIGWLKKIFYGGEHPVVTGRLITVLAKHWTNESDDILNLKKIAQSDETFDGRQQASIKALIECGEDSKEVIDFLYQTTIENHFSFPGTSLNIRLQENPRQAITRILLEFYPGNHKVLELLHDRAQNDPDPQLRQWAQEQLQKLEVNP